MVELGKNDKVLSKVKILFILIFGVVVIISESSEVFAFDAYTNRNLYEPSVATKLILEADRAEAIKTSIIVPEVSPCYYKENNEIKIWNASIVLKEYIGKEHEADRLGNLYKVDLNGEIYYLPVIATKGLDEYKYVVTEEVVNEDDFSREKIYGWVPKSLPEYIQDEINNFEDRISGKISFQDIISEYIVSMYNLGLNYGGELGKQYDYEDRNTMCLGLTYVTEQLLSKSNIKYRIVVSGPNKLTSSKHGHIWIEVFNEEDGKWYKIETTSIAYNKLQKGKEKSGENWVLSQYDNLINENNVVEPFDLKRELIKKGKKQTSEYIIKVSSEYINQNKVEDKGYELIRREFST